MTHQDFIASMIYENTELILAVWDTMNTTKNTCHLVWFLIFTWPKS